MILILAIFPGLPALAAEPGELARVAILEFQDNTGQPSYGWVKKSLPDAINDSMKQHFEFNRADSRIAEKNSEKILGYASAYTPEMAEQTAKDYNFDILIFGDYRFDTAKRVATINASIYHRKAGRVIGSVTEMSKLDNELFTKIDIISKKIVELVYRYSLDLSDEDAAKRREQDIRLLVLAPTWSNEGQKKAATAELELQKKELKKKYPAEILTLFEFLTARKIPPPERRQVEDFAKSRNDQALIAWLQEKKVANAMIVFVGPGKVFLRPVINGQEKATFSYAPNAPAAEKISSMEKAVTDSGLHDNLIKTSIRSVPAIWGRYSVAGGGFYAVPIGQGTDQIYPGFGAELQFLYRAIHTGWLQFGGVLAVSAAQFTHLLNTGENDLLLRQASALAGPALLFPMPFFRPLELQASVLAGGTYAQLEKYKYANETLVFKSANASVAAQVELRWHIWRGIFIGTALNYQQIFYSGTDMHLVSINARAGYRF